MNNGTNGVRCGIKSRGRVAASGERVASSTDGGGGNSWVKLGVWHAECWDSELGQRLPRLDYLGTQAELYAVGRGGTEEVRELMMRRLKDTT